MLDKAAPPIKLQQTDDVVHHYASDIYNPKRLINLKVPGFKIAAMYDDTAIQCPTASPRTRLEMG